MRVSLFISRRRRVIVPPIDLKRRQEVFPNIHTNSLLGCHRPITGFFKRGESLILMKHRQIGQDRPMYIHCLPSGKIINVIRPFKVLITQKKVTCETSCCEKALFYGPHVQISVVLIAAFCVIGHPFCEILRMDFPTNRRGCRLMFFRLRPHSRSYPVVFIN